jgi:hypothetical protein
VYPNFVDEICVPDQANFRSKWSVEDTVPANACPRQMGKAADVVIDDPSVLNNINRLRTAYNGLSDSDVGLAQRAVRFTFQYGSVEQHEGDNERNDPFALACSLFSTVFNHVIPVCATCPAVGSGLL